MARHSVDSFPALSPSRRTLPHPDNNGSVIEIQFGADPDTLNTQQIPAPQFDFFQPATISSDTRERFDAIVASLQDTHYEPLSGDVLSDLAEAKRLSWPQNIRQKIGAAAVGLRRLLRSSKRRGVHLQAGGAISGPDHFNLADPYSSIPEAEQAVYKSLEAQHASLPIDNQPHYLFTHYGATPLGAFYEHNFDGVPSGEEHIRHRTTSA